MTQKLITAVQIDAGPNSGQIAVHDGFLTADYLNFQVTEVGYGGNSNTLAGTNDFTYSYGSTTLNLGKSTVGATILGIASSSTGLPFTIQAGPGTSAVGGNLVLNGGAGISGSYAGGSVIIQTQPLASGVMVAALTINSAGAFGLGSTPSYGTAGQVLTSNGSTAAPSWAAPVSAITSVVGTTNQITATTSSSVVTLSIPTTFVAPGYIAETSGLFFSNATIAAAGTTQGTATAITTTISIIGSGTGGVILPAPVRAGQFVIISNKTSSAITIYPSTGAQIGTAGVNIGVTLNAGGTVSYYAASTILWYVQKSAPSAGTGISITYSNGTDTYTNTGVLSFNSRTGAVSPTTGDYSFSQISGSVTASQMPALTGDVTTTAGSVATTLATVNSNIGTWNNVTVNAKGLVTAGSNVAYLTATTGVSSFNGGSTGLTPSSSSSDPSFSNVVLLLTFDGTNNSTTYTDSSSYNNTVNNGTGAYITTTNPKFGTGSLQISGVSTFGTNAINVPYTSGSPLDIFTQSSWTIEGWILGTSNTSYNQFFISYGDSGNGSVTWNGMCIVLTVMSGNTVQVQAENTGTGSVGVYSGATGSISVTGSYAANVYHHIALVNNAGTTTIYLDGVAGGSTTSWTPSNYRGALTGAAVCVGSFSTSGSLTVFEIDEVRVSTVARYTSNFTPPTSAFPIGSTTGAVSLGGMLNPTYGGTGVTATPTSGQLLIGNGSGYTLNTLTGSTGLTVTNGSGTITLTNSGVTSLVAGSSTVLLNGSTVTTPATGTVTVQVAVGGGSAASGPAARLSQ